LDRAFVVYDINLITPEKIAITITQKTDFGAKVLDTGEVNPELLKSDCAFLGLFCD
jgi:hypothetical protein